MSDLYSSIEKGDTTRVLELLRQGDVLSILNKANGQGVFPLHVAAKAGNVQIADILIQNKAKVTCLDSNGLTPVHYAARSGHKDVLSLFLQHNKQVDSQTQEFWTPLHYATYYGHTDVVKLLCDSKASIEETNFAGQTPLHLACKSGFKEIIEILMSHGARVNMSDSSGKTPLELLNLKDIDKTQPINNEEGLQSLSDDLKNSLLRKDIFSDISFVFSDEQKIFAHKNIIHARAPEFLNKISEQKDENDPSIIRPKDTSYGACRLLLEWIYTAAIEIEELDLDIAMELYTKSDHYNLPILKVFVEGVLNSNLDISTAKAVFDAALKANANKIIETCSNYIANNFGKIINSNSKDENQIFSREDLREISSRLDIIESSPPIFRDEPVPTESKPAITQPVKAERKEISTVAPVSQSNSQSVNGSSGSSRDTKKSSSYAPPKQAPQSTKTNERKVAPIKDEPIDQITPKNIDLIKKLVQDIYDQDIAIDFRDPVPKDYPGYATIIKNPMDLGTIKKNLSAPKKKYKMIQDVAADIRLVFNNARTFNQTGSAIYDHSDQLVKIFEENYSVLKAKLNLGKSFDPPKVFVPPEYNPVVLPSTPAPQTNSRKKKAEPKEESSKKKKSRKKK